MTDKDFWMLIRRALLMICGAIEKRYSEELEHERPMRGIRHAKAEDL